MTALVKKIMLNFDEIGYSNCAYEIMDASTTYIVIRKYSTLFMPLVITHKHNNYDTYHYQYGYNWWLSCGYEF